MKCTVSSKRKLPYNFDNDSPRKIKLCSSKGANCEEIINTDNSTINDEVPLLTNTQVDQIYSDADAESNISSDFSADEFSLTDQTINNVVTIEDCSVAYFAGYLAHKCTKQFICNLWKNDLLTDKNLSDKKQLLIINKNYSSILNDDGLRVPSIAFIEIINRILIIFEKQFVKVEHSKKVRAKLLQIIKKKYYYKWKILNHV